MDAIRILIRVGEHPLVGRRYWIVPPSVNPDDREQMESFISFLSHIHRGFSSHELWTTTTIDQENVRLDEINPDYLLWYKERETV